MAEKFLVISGGGDGLGLALRLRMEGHNVAVSIREKRAKQNYDGLLVKLATTQWPEFLDAATTVVFDSSGGGRTAARLKGQGHFVFAGSPFADTLELDRPAAFELMRQAGIKTPEFQTFTSWEKGKAFAKDYGDRLVFKATGNTDGQVGSYVSYDTGDLVEMLDYFAGIVTGRPEFILQEFVEGTEVSSEGWFNGERFMEPWNHTLERKQLMNDGLGPSGGCAGNVVWPCREADHVITQGILLMAPVLRENQFIGPVDLNSVVNEEGVWGLEFTPRFGYDALPALLELVEGEIGPVIASMARGEVPTSLPLVNKHAAGLRVTIPPYPSEHFHPDEGIPIRGLTREDREHLYFYDVMLNPANQLVATPAYGTVVAITGSSFDGITGAFEGPMEIAKRAKIPQKQYRTDLPTLFVNEWAKLEKLINEEDLHLERVNETVPVDHG
jgi:phosphoribosylamine--glycine ligase